jgi:tetratricopeptide (TPR) repeat protein
MSSRALRKLQKQREQEAQLAALQSQDQASESDDEGPQTFVPKPKINAFDLLNTPDEDEPESENETPVEITPGPSEANVAATKPSGAKRKKKKKKKASKGPDTPGKQPAAAEEKDLDEIDRALRELSTTQHPAVITGDPSLTTPGGQNIRFAKSLEELLAIDPKSLNAMNEMRKLFGNVVMESFDQPGNTGSGRRRERQTEMVDLGRALTGRYSPASRGQSLAGVTLRKNILMQGKDEWPRAPSGGLGMELVEKLPTGNSIYKIVHNAAYRDVQMQFDICVESMDPQRLIHLLQYNREFIHPSILWSENTYTSKAYHISTLLQVSEISKQQGDHAVSADLLERALFNIGRSAHSSFGNQLKEGKAKLDFIHMENREVWLVGWRYIANLGMKGTWRTAYEWAKLLLSLDTKDPYCMRLLIDHLALRGRQYEHFIDLCTQSVFIDDWDQFPNIHCSLALAYFRLNKQKEAREQLRRAMSRYPWIYCRLAQELDIQPIPQRIWGKMPPTQSQELLTELYISRTKDLWNTPEVVTLVVEIADTLPEKEEPVEPPEITLDIARHVVLSDIPKVTTHLPSRFTSGRISSSDPLPPYDSEAFRQQSDPTPSYLSRVPEVGRPQWLRDFLERLNDGRGGPEIPRFPDDGDTDLSDDEILPELESDPEAGGEHGPTQPPPSGSDQAVLERWLLGQGLRSLQSFLRQYGIDRGNWGEVVHFTPLAAYVDALNALQSDSARQQLLHGPIRDNLGDMAVEILQDELQMLDDEIYD